MTHKISTAKVSTKNESVAEFEIAGDFCYNGESFIAWMDSFEQYCRVHKTTKKNCVRLNTDCTAEIKPRILTGGRPPSRKLDFREQCIYKTNFVVHVTSCHWELRQEEK